MRLAGATPRRTPRRFIGFRTPQRILLDDHPEPSPQGEVAWHAHVAQEAPAGAGIENAVFRWRPTLEQVGEHRLNIIITDGESPCCQVVVIRVLPGGRRTEPRILPRLPDRGPIGSRHSPQTGGSAAEFAGGISENLMILRLCRGSWVFEYIFAREPPASSEF